MTFGNAHWKLAVTALAAIALLGIPHAAAAGQAGGDDVTFTKDIAPILQRSCQSCHRPNSVAPMSLITYEEVRPWARSIKQRTALRNRMGVMPPWFIEKDVGIQRFKDDISLSEAEIETIGAWVDAGARRAATRPTCRRRSSSRPPTSGTSASRTSSSRARRSPWQARRPTTGARCLRRPWATPRTATSRPCRSRK